MQRTTVVQPPMQRPCMLWKFLLWWNIIFSLNAFWTSPENSVDTPLLNLGHHHNCEADGAAPKRRVRGKMPAWSENVVGHKFFSKLDGCGSYEILIWGVCQPKSWFQWCGRCVLIMHLAVPLGMSKLIIDTVASGSAKRTCEKVKMMVCRSCFFWCFCQDWNQTIIQRQYRLLIA